MAPADFVRFREDLRALPEAETLSVHLVQRMLGEARKWLRGLLRAGEIDQSLFLLLHPKGKKGDYDARILQSRAFRHLSPSIARSYRRGAQALLLHLAACGRDLGEMGPPDWAGFSERLRAAVKNGEIKAPVARMRLAGARVFIEERIKLGRVRADVLARPVPIGPAWPAALLVWPMRLEEAMTVAGLAASTREHYTRMVRGFLDYLASEGITDLTQVTREVVTAYQLALQQATSKRGTPYAVTTQIGALAALRLFFGYLLKSGYLLADPSVHLSYPRAPRKLPRPVGVDAMKRLLHAIPKTKLGLRDRAIVELFYETGLRGGELAHLRMPDIDLESATILVREGKGRKDRMVPLGRAAKQALIEYLEPVRVELSRGSTNAVFLGVYGGALSARQVRRRLAELGARVGVGLYPHLLRHTCATHLLKGRADIRHIQRLLGHRSLATTERYTRVEVSDLREVIRRCHPREKRT
jgi:integrase/recombinase XerD